VESLSGHFYGQLIKTFRNMEGKEKIYETVEEGGREKRYYSTRRLGHSNEITRNTRGVIEIELNNAREGLHLQ